MAQDAVIRNIEIIGEASNNIEKRFPEFAIAHPDMQVEWDSENGTLAGPGAAHLQLLIDSVVEDGYVIGHPYPTSYPMTDPLRIPEEMATLLVMYWHLPEDMIPLIMPPPEDPDTGIPTLDGKPVELIY